MLECTQKLFKQHNKKTSCITVYFDFEFLNKLSVHFKLISIHTNVHRCSFLERLF